MLSEVINVVTSSRFVLLRIISIHFERLWQVLAPFTAWHSNPQCEAIHAELFEAYALEVVLPSGYVEGLD